MNGDRFELNASDKPQSVIAAASTGYGQAVHSSFYGPFSLYPPPAISALPTAAIIYQVQHGRETAVLEEYRALSANWDGHDADPISDAACSAARMFLVSLPSSLESPDLCPNPSGTISMEWESAQGQAQLELGRSKYSFYLRQKGGVTVYQKGETRLASSVYALLAALYANPRPKSISQIEY